MVNQSLLYSSGYIGTHGHLDIVHAQRLEDHRGRRLLMYFLLQIDLSQVNGYLNLVTLLNFKVSKHPRRHNYCIVVFFFKTLYVHQEL